MQRLSFLCILLLILPLLGLNAIKQDLNQVKNSTVENMHNQQHAQKATNRVSHKLQDGFVYMDQVDPSIITNLRYFTTQNFVGQVLIGYYANRAILTKEAAQALKNVNSDLSKDGYTLVIYDTYRPQKTVNRFLEWSFDDNAISQKPKYYPYIDKSVLFNSGYIAKKSGHTRGSTVDITIIKKDLKIKPVQTKLRELQNGQLIFLLDDNTQDFGSSFDLFSEASHPINTVLPREYLQKRQYLIQIMKKNGFKGILTQWWHYTLQNQPFPDTYFDFDIK